MTLGLSVIGWSILFLVYLPVAAFLTWVGVRRGVRSAAFVLTFLITAVPFAAAIGEAAYVERNWQALCATATTEVKRRVLVEGFYDDGFRTEGWQVLHGGKSGFRYVEWKDQRGRLWRTEGFSEPTLRTVAIDRPSARYQWRMPQFPVAVGYRLEKREETVSDLQTGEVIGKSVTGYRYPAFVDQLWRRWFDRVPQKCGTNRIVRGEVLIGIDSEEASR